MKSKRRNPLGRDKPLRKVPHKVLEFCPVCLKEKIVKCKLEEENLNRWIVFLHCKLCGGAVFDWYDKRTVTSYRRGMKWVRYRDEWV